MATSLDVPQRLHYSRSRFVRFVASRRGLRSLTAGHIDEATFVDGEPDLIRHEFGTDVPRGAPFFVRGWAVDLGRKSVPWDVRVEIDGREVAAQVRQGFERPDVAKHLRSPAALKSGFRAYLETRNLGVGPHDLRIRAIVGRRGAAFAKIPSTVRMFVHDLLPRALGPLRDSGEAPSACSLDPLAPVPTGSVLALGGWAFDRREQPLRAVAAQIDEAAWNCGWMNGERGGGFNVRIRLDTVSPGSHALRIAGKAVDGQWIALGAPRNLIVTHVAEPFSPGLRALAATGEAAIAGVPTGGLDGVPGLTVAANSTRPVQGELRRTSPTGTPVSLVARAPDGTEVRFAAWSAPTADANVLMFGAVISAQALRPGAYHLFVDAPDAIRRSLGRADAHCRLIVE